MRVHGTQAMALFLTLIAAITVFESLDPPLWAVVSGLSFLFGLVLAPCLLVGPPAIVITPPASSVASTALFDFQAIRRSLFGLDGDERRRRDRQTAALRRSLFAPERGRDTVFRAVGRAMFAEDASRHRSRGRRYGSYPA